MSANKPATIRPNRKKSPNRKQKTGPGEKWWRQNSRLLPAIIPLAFVLMMSLCFLYGYKLVTAPGRFGLQTIEVKGACLLRQDAVIRRARLSVGDNLLAINLAAVRRNLLADPWIGEAEVTRELPARITLHIREYVPLAVVDMGAQFFVNKAERLFKRAAPSDPGTLPVIRGLGYGDLTAAGKPDSPAYQAALEVIRTSREVEHLIPGMKLREVIVDRDSGIAVRAFDGIGEICLGFADYYNKFRKLNKILQDWENRGDGRRIAEIRFACPGRVVVKPATEGA